MIPLPPMGNEVDIAMIARAKNIGLESVPRLDDTTIKMIAANSTSDCVIDKVYPGRPLIISFNYYTQINVFDFFTRIRKLESQCAAPFNRLFLRDRKYAWYQAGVAGLGDTVEEMAAHLRDLITLIAPSEVIMIGQSMGGYAAIHFGLLLQASKMIAFGPLSYLKADWAERDGDLRWLAILKVLSSVQPKGWCDDLVQLAQRHMSKEMLHIVYGTNPNGKDNLPNFDAIHLQRFASIPGLHIHAYPEAPHEVTEWLLNNEEYDALLNRLIIN